MWHGSEAGIRKWNGNGNREWLFGVENGKTTSNWRLNIFLAQLWETIILKQRWGRERARRGERKEARKKRVCFYLLLLKL